MNKKELLNLKTKIISLSLVSVMFTAACNNRDYENHDIPLTFHISKEYGDFEKYYKYSNSSDHKEKIYDSNYIYFFIDRETYETKEYILDTQSLVFGLNARTELYDLQKEEIMVYSDGVNTIYNEGFYNYLFNNGYMIPLSNIGLYIENYEPNCYYTLEELKDLEVLLIDSIKKNER